MLERFKQMWLGWQGVAKGILTAQNMLIMGVAYFVGLTPVVIVLRLLRVKLLDRGPAAKGATTFWLARSGKAMTMEEASRQF